MKRLKMATEQKLIVLIKADIDILKSIFEDSEIIRDEDKKVLNQKRDKSRKDNIVLGDLFLFCFDTLSDYSYLFEDEDNKDLRKNVENYLFTFYDLIPRLRELVSNYEDGEVGSYFDGEKVKDYVTLYREKMGKLVNVFFGIVSGEEI